MMVRRWLRRLSVASVVLLVLGLVLAIAAAVFLWYAARSPEGSNFIINRATAWVPGLKVVEPEGSLWGDFKASRVEVQLGGGSRLTLTNPRWRGLHAYRVAWAPWRMQWHVDELSADTADLLWVSAPQQKKQPFQAPTQLNLPVALHVGELALGRFQSNLTGEVPFLDVRGAVDVQQIGKASGRPEHRLVVNSLRWQQWLLSGQARIAAEGDLAVDARVRAEGTEVAGDAADLTIIGPMKQLQVQATVRIAGRAGQTEPQSLILDGELAPFSPWPLPRASLQAERFDVQRLAAALPHTALSGRVTVVPKLPPPEITAPASAPAPGPTAKAKARPTGRAKDVVADIDLRNDAAGLWDAGRVPLTGLRAQVVLPGQADTATITALGRHGRVDAQVGLPASVGRNPGNVALQGRWDLDQPQGTDVRATLTRVETQALHSKSPPLMLLGTLGVVGLADGTWQMTGALDGKDQGGSTAARPAQASFQANWSTERLLIESIKLASGDSQAIGKGQWARQESGGWTAEGEVDVKAFDPAAWLPWPRPPGDAVQRTRLDGTFNGEIRAALPDPATWRGAGKLALSNSLLLGVPFNAKGQWEMADGKGAGQAGRVLAGLDIQSGASEIKADVLWPLAARPVDPDKPTPAVAGAELTARLQVPKLAEFQPWANALGWQGLSGTLQGDITARQPSLGQWVSTGDIKAEGVQAERPGGGRLVLTGTSARWNVDTGSASSPWTIDAKVAQAQWGGWAVQQGAVALDGTRQNHQLNVQARVDLPERRMPSGQQVRESALAQLRVQAGWQGELLAADAGRAARGWAAQVKTLKVVPLAADGNPASGPSAWLDVQPFGMSWRQTGDRQQASATATHLSLFGARLDLSRLQWQQQGQQAGQTEVILGLEPLKLADLLARIQPQAGWGGDLTIAGRVSAVHRPGAPWVVDAQIARQAGDLTITELDIGGNTVQRLGVRQLQLDLKARDGVWRATELIDVRVGGTLRGEQVVQVKDPSALPSANDALSGRITMEAANVRSLGVWAPAGWRITGQLLAEATLGGTLGQPRYAGRVTGRQLAVANALQGIQFTDGDLLLTLDGEQAKLDHLTLKGGDGGGTLNLSGDIALARQPVATLLLTAERFALLQRVDRRALVSGEARVNLAADAIKIDGRFMVDEGLVDISRSEAPTIGDDVNVVNRPGEPPEDAEGGEPPAAQRKLDMTVTVDLGSKLRLRGKGIDTHLAGAARVTTPNGRLQVHGTIQAVDGTYAAYGQKLVIERGAISFTGPVENPRLDIQAMRAQSPTAAASDVKVGVLITGTAQDPRVRLYSEPAMSETEKLSWLILGRGPVGLGGADIGLLRTAATALLAGEGGSSTDDVLSAIGLDELSVRQTDGAVRDTIVTVGKQISEKVYVGYERSLNATTGSWQLIYRAARRFTLRAQTGEDNAVDLIWSWRWD